MHKYATLEPCSSMQFGVTLRVAVLGGGPFDAYACQALAFKPFPVAELVLKLYPLITCDVYVMCKGTRGHTSVQACFRHTIGTVEHVSEDIQSAFVEQVKTAVTRRPTLCCCL